MGRCRRRGRGCRAVPAQMCSVSPHSSSTRAVPSFGQWLGACGVPAAQLPFARVTPPTVALHVVGARVSPAQVRKNTAGWGPQPLWKAKFSRPVSSGQAIPPRRPTLRVAAYASWITVLPPDMFSSPGWVEALVGSSW